MKLGAVTTLLATLAVASMAQETELRFYDAAGENKGAIGLDSQGKHLAIESDAKGVMLLKCGHSVGYLGNGDPAPGKDSIPVGGLGIGYSDTGITYASHELVIKDNGYDDKPSVLFSGNGHVGKMGLENEDMVFEGSGDMVVRQEARFEGSVYIEQDLVIQDWTISQVAPDYVFEKDYKLRSLEEVEKHVVENKHLPEVPSAKEMGEKGLNLVEMNMTLLKKIEELTLYTIRQQKEIDSLKAAVARE